MSTVTQATYANPDEMKFAFGDALKDFFVQHTEGTLQVFHSLTVGEMVIAVLIALLILVFIFKWIWEAIRYS